MKNKYNTKLCDNDMTFQECELAILRHAVDETEKIQQQKISNSEEIKRLIHILENFLRKKKCICYGGTAINNILPKFAQFYNRDIEIPDYDFYSKNALDDAKELADIYFKEGYKDVEAKAGVHHGTYKVFVNFIGIADITYLHPEIFDVMSKESIRVSGILYSPPNFLRMNMFLELSRPSGDVSRWEKVLKRITLLNEYYPLKSNLHCGAVDFQRKMESNEEDSEKIYYMVRDTLIDQGVVFFGGYAVSLYAKHMPKDQRERLIKKIPDFDVISEDYETCAVIVKERLQDAGYKNIKTVMHSGIGELLPEHIEIIVGNDTIAFIYKPIACHSYNLIKLENREIKIATIDTMLSFYFAFYYTKRTYYFKDRILCMAMFLFDVEQENRLEQKGILKRFSLDCYGKQATLETIRSEKVEKYKELKDKRNTREYEEWFLKYTPGQKNMKNEEKQIDTGSQKSKSKSSKKKSKEKTKGKKRTTQRRLFF